RRTKTNEGNDEGRRNSDPASHIPPARKCAERFESKGVCFAQTRTRNKAKLALLGNFLSTSKSCLASWSGAGYIHREEFHLATNPELLITGPSNAFRTIALAHGAGAGMNTPFMDAFATGFAGQGIRVVRFEF